MKKSFSAKSLSVLEFFFHVNLLIAKYYILLFIEYGHELKTPKSKTHTKSVIVYENKLKHFVPYSWEWLTWKERLGYVLASA